VTSAPAASRAPLTDRGRRTRQSLLVAARGVFERQGFTGTRMGDIAAAAGVSHGTVYTYFQTKEAVLAAVVQEVIDDLVASLRASTAPDPLDRIRDANARYLDAYAEHAQLLRVVEEAAFTDDTFGEILAALRRTHVSRVASAIRRLQREGVASADLDGQSSAAALCAMVEGFARHHSTDAAANHTLTTLWARALGLSHLQ
jgi:AcrR family transcriptional regulator